MLYHWDICWDPGCKKHPTNITPQTHITQTENKTLSLESCLLNPKTWTPNPWPQIIDSKSQTLNHRPTITTPKSPGRREYKADALPLSYLLRYRLKKNPTNISPQTHITQTEDKTLNLESCLLNPKTWTPNPWPQIKDSKSQTLNHRPTITTPKSLTVNHQPWILDPGPWILETKSWALNPGLQIPNPQSWTPNPRPKISNLRPRIQIPNP